MHAQIEAALRTYIYHAFKLLGIEQEKLPITFTHHITQRNDSF